MRFRYKNYREPMENAEISIIPSKRTTKEKGILERMIERAVIKTKVKDALSMIGIASSGIKNYYPYAYQN